MLRSLEDFELDAVHGGNDDPETALEDPDQIGCSPPPPPAC